MQPVELLYLIVAVAVVVLVTALVWLISDLVQLSRSLRRSTDDVAVMTGEVKEKVLMVSEAFDRIGTLATHFIGIIEEAEKQIRDKSEQISQGLGMVVGVSDALRKRKAASKEEDVPDEQEEETLEKNVKDSKGESKKDDK